MQNQIRIPYEECVSVLESIQVCINLLLEQIEVENVEVLIEHMPVVSEFSEVLEEILPVFGYEEYVSIPKDVIKFCTNCETKEFLGNNLSDCAEHLNKLLRLVKAILNERSEKCKTCACCGKKVYYMPLSDYYESERKKYNAPKHIPETLNEDEYLCPNCGSSDRDRLIVEFLKRIKLHHIKENETLLHFAPARTIEHWIHANCTGLKYQSTDLYMHPVSFLSDIQDMNMVEDESFDYFICSHVLEHVQDDRKALRELCRILKNDGIGIFLVPIALDVEEVDEEWGLTEAENWVRFGQGDHCRQYSKEGLVHRLKEAGFCVHQLGKDYFGQEVFNQCGALDSSILYVLTKADVSIESLICEKIEKRKYVEKQEPLVSVILPTYNHEEYVAAAIESVLNQTYRNYELLVADDASVDGTAQEVLKYEDKIDYLYLSKKNTGTRIIGDLLEHSRGKYIAMMHSDDLWTQDKLQVQVEYLESHQECAACFTGCDSFNNKGQILRNHVFAMINMNKEQWMSYLFERGNCLAHPSVLIRREVYIDLRNDSKYTMFRQLPDFWMWLHLIQKHEIHIIERPLTLFRFHEEDEYMNTSAVTRDNLERHRKEETYIWYNIIKNMDDEYFIKAFRDCLIKKDASSKEEILCEKFFVLLNIPRVGRRHAAIFYLYEIYQMQGIAELLEAQYHFSDKDIYMLSIE